MGNVVRLPALGPKLRPIDRHVLDLLGDRRRPVSAGELAKRSSYGYPATVAALERLVAMGYASRVDVGGAGVLVTYAAHACPWCGQFVADRAHACRAPGLEVWRPGSPRVLGYVLLIGAALVLACALLW